jgi:hypothetical protein
MASANAGMTAAAAMRSGSPTFFAALAAGVAQSRIASYLER